VGVHADCTTQDAKRKPVSGLDDIVVMVSRSIKAAMMPFGEGAFRYVPGLWAMFTTPDTSNMRLVYARFEELDAQAEVENWPVG
jgi:hypothetical protein